MGINMGFLVDKKSTGFNSIRANMRRNLLVL